MSSTKPKPSTTADGKGSDAKKAPKNAASKKSAPKSSVALKTVLTVFVVVAAIVILQADSITILLKNILNSSEDARLKRIHAEWLEYISPQFDFIAGAVPRIEVTPEEEFTEKVAASNQPLVISGSAATKWRAAQTWNPEYLASRVPLFEGVQFHKNKTFFYFHSRPMESIPLIRNNYKSTVPTKLNLPSLEFFRKLLRPPPYNDFYYFSGNTDLLGDVMHDLYPVEPLMLKPSDFDPAESYKHRWTHVWIGPSGATTHLHYDIYHNFYVQLYGYKRFILIAPEQMDSVYLYPVLHPGGQSSQVDFERPDLEKYPKFKNVKAIEAILGPGDVLYVPPLWLHHVTALDVSISVSVWSRSAETQLMWEVEKQPIPVKRTWNDEKKLLGARYYLESVIDGLYGPGSAKPFVANVLEQRYARLMKEVPTVNPQDQSYCVETLAVDDEDFRKEYEQGAQIILNEVIPRFQQLESDAVRRVWLANLCENVAFAATDAAHAGVFLQDFVNC